MLQTQANALTVAESSETDSTQSRTRDVQAQAVQSHYADAEDFALEDYTFPVPGFVAELFDELGKDLVPEDAKLVDTVEPTSDIDDGLLVAFPDESLMFLGLDPTAKDTSGWYAFTIEPMEPTPAPRSAQEALDLLKPREVQETISTENWIPNRHGEWWLLPTSLVPVSEPFNPGVASSPYGPSPLGNHVPQEYAFTSNAGDFLQRFQENVTSAPNSIQTVPEVIKWSSRQQNKKPSVRPDDAPSWADIRSWAGEILVKGTIRHRDNDHYIEDCGDVWHKAVTHRMEVYTTDGIGEGVHLDYYGQ